VANFALDNESPIQGVNHESLLLRDYGGGAHYLLKINTANASVIIQNAIVDVQDGGSDLNTKVSVAAIIMSDTYNRINLTKSSPRLGRMNGFPAMGCPNLILDAAINPSMSAVVSRNGTSR
jgi:hypothetical protein